MYAVNGRSCRAIASPDDLLPGEVLANDLPVEAIASDPVEETKVLMSNWLDGYVQAKGYDNIVSCASYATSTDPRFRAEAEAAIAWRDAVYAKGYEILADVPAGVSTPQDVMALLPQPDAFGWPE